VQNDEPVHRIPLSVADLRHCGTFLVLRDMLPCETYLQSLWVYQENRWFGQSNMGGPQAFRSLIPSPEGPLFLLFLFSEPVTLVGFLVEAVLSELADSDGKHD
jgi:hypothetical protein